jgi:hypothetical protein
MSIKITNKYGAPEELYKAACFDDHVTKGDISVTTLIGSPRVRMLKADNEIEEDVNDHVFMMLGTAVHSMMETATYTNRDYETLKFAHAALKRMGLPDLAKQIGLAAKKGFPDEQVGKTIFSERTLTLDITQVSSVDDKEYTYKVSGTQDYYNATDKLLRDYKVCGTTKYAEDEHIEWERQQNIYAHMLRAIGCPVDKIEILAIFRDWGKMKYIMSPNKKADKYPNSVFKIIPLRVWSPEECDEYIRERVKLHYEASQTNKLPLCTFTERWAKPDAFAVMSETRKHAAKICYSKTAAEEYVKDNKAKLTNPYIEFRIDVGFKCKFYCSVAHLCEQKKKREEYVANSKKKKV